MKAFEIFSYGIALIGLIVFVILIFRRPAEVDYMQEWDRKLNKIINSSTRIMFFILHGWLIFYMSYQVMHDKPIDIMVVITILTVAWGGKAGIDAIKKEKPDGNS